MSISVVQNKTGNNGNSTTGTSVTLNVVLTSVVTSGNAIAVAIVADANGQSCSVSNVTDDKANTYSFPVSDYYSVPQSLTSCAVALNVTNGPQTISVTVDTTPSATVRIVATVYELSGVATSSAIDANTTYRVTSNSTTYLFPFTTANANDFAMVASGSNNNSASFTQNNGWTQDAAAPSNLSAYTFHKILGASGSDSLNMTPSAGQFSNNVVMTLKPSSGPSSGAPIAWLYA